MSKIFLLQALLRGTCIAGAFCSYGVLRSVARGRISHFFVRGLLGGLVLWTVWRERFDLHVQEHTIDI